MLSLCFFVLLSLTSALKVPYATETLRDDVVALDPIKPTIASIRCTDTETAFDFASTLLPSIVAGKFVTGGPIWKCDGEKPFYRKLTKLVSTKGLTRVFSSTVVTVNSVAVDSYKQVTEKVNKLVTEGNNNLKTIKAALNNLDGATKTKVSSEIAALEKSGQNAITKAKAAQKAQKNADAEKAIELGNDMKNQAEKLSLSIKSGVPEIDETRLIIQDIKKTLNSMPDKGNNSFGNIVEQMNDILQSLAKAETQLNKISGMAASLKPAFPDVLDCLARAKALHTEVTSQGSTGTISPINNAITLSSYYIASVICKPTEITIIPKTPMTFKILPGNVIKGDNIRDCVDVLGRPEIINRQVVSVLLNTSTKVVVKTLSPILTSIFSFMSPIDNVFELNKLFVKDVKCQGDSLTLEFAYDLNFRATVGNVIVSEAFKCVNESTKSLEYFAKKILLVRSSSVRTVVFKVSDVSAQYVYNGKGTISFHSEQEGSVTSPRQKITFALKVSDTSLRGALVQISLVGTNTQSSSAVVLSKTSDITTIMLSPSSKVTGSKVAVKVSMRSKVLATSKKTFYLNPPFTVTLNPDVANAKFYNDDIIKLAFKPGQSSSQLSYNLVSATTNAKVSVKAKTSSSSGASFSVETFASSIKDGRYFFSISNSKYVTQTDSFLLYRTRGHDTFSFLNPLGGESYKKGDKFVISWNATNYQTGATVKLELCSDKSLLPGDSCKTLTKSIAIDKFKYEHTVSKEYKDSDYYIKASFDCSTKCAIEKSEFFAINFGNIFDIEPPLLKGKIVTVKWNISNPADPLVKANKEFKIYLVNDGKDTSSVYKVVRPSNRKVEFDLGSGDMKNKRLSFHTGGNIFKKNYEYSSIISLPLQKEFNMDLDFTWDLSCSSCETDGIISLNVIKGERPEIEVKPARLLFCGLCTAFNLKSSELKEALNDWKNLDIKDHVAALQKLYLTENEDDVKQNFAVDLKDQLISNAGIKIVCEGNHFNVGLRLEDVEMTGIKLRSYKAVFDVDYSVIGTVTISSGISPVSDKLSDIVYSKVKKATDPLGKAMSSKHTLKDMRIPLFGPSIMLGGYSFPGSKNKFRVGAGLDIALKFEINFAAELTFRYKFIGKSTNKYSLTSNKYVSKENIVQKKEKDISFDNVRLEATISVVVEAKAYITVFELIDISLTVELVRLDLVVTFRYPAFTGTEASDALVSITGSKCNQSHYLEISTTISVLIVKVNFSVLGVSLLSANFGGFQLASAKFCPV